MEQKSDIRHEIRLDIQKNVERMRALRDEIRLKIHLAGMDARDEWRKLEPKIEEVERAAHHLTEATRAAASDAVKRLSNLRSRLS